MSKTLMQICFHYVIISNSHRFDPFLTVKLNIPDNKKKFIELKLYLNGFFDFTRKFIPFSQS